MPHFPHTPEALLGRNDSKNPNNTCCGITSSGRACRRAVASPKSSPVNRRPFDALPPNAPLYCWQHKDQAQLEGEQDEQTRRRPQRTTPPIFPLQQRSSIDTLVQKLGIHTEHAEEEQKPDRRPDNHRPPRRTAAYDCAHRPSVSQAPYAEKYRPSAPRRPREQKKRPGFWVSLCCFTTDDDDYLEVVRHRKRVQQMQQPNEPSSSHYPAPTPPAAPKPVDEVPSSTAQAHSLQDRQTQHLLSLIPAHLSATTTSALLAELIKPISPYDEDGYIYIFWLTPQSKAPPDESTARALLSPRHTRPPNARSISDVMTEYSYQAEETSTKSPGVERSSKEGTGKKTIMLKIGRANNITRRMNEWQRQCGYALTLVRWYPYIPSSTSPQPSPPHRPSEPLYPDLSRPASQQRRQSGFVHKCPHVHRVERLIHLEMAARQVRRRCGACGKEHREWFEVEATLGAVGAVDEMVKRWVGWAERLEGDGRN